MLMKRADIWGVWAAPVWAAAGVQRWSLQLRQAEEKKCISLLCSVPPPPRHYKAVMFTRETDCSPTHIQQASFQCATITRLAALLQSGAGACSSPPRFRVSVRGEWTLLCSDTRQMFHSNVAFAYCGGSNEFSRGRPAGPGSPCRGWARGRRPSTAAKLNLMSNPLQERCINQSFWFAWTVASKHKPGQKMMSWGKQCNLMLPNKNKQKGRVGGAFNSDCCSDVRYIIKNRASARFPSFIYAETRTFKRLNTVALSKKNDCLNKQRPKIWTH